MCQSCDGQGVPHLSPKVDWVSENLSFSFNYFEAKKII